MKILLTTETYLPWITGVSVSTDNIAHFLAGRGHTVTIVCPKQLVKGVVQERKNIKVITVPSIPFTFYNRSATPIVPFAYFKIRNLMRSEKFDVVHIQEPGWTGILALILAKNYHVPVFGALHFIPEQIDRVLWGGAERILTPIINIYVRFIYDRYNAVMTPSHFFKNYLKFLGVKSPIEVISNGVDTEKFKPRSIDLSFRKKHNIPVSSILFFYIGRLDGDKNVGTLVKAMKYTNPDVHMLIIGKGKIAGYLHSLATKEKSNSKITWIDFISDEEMIDAYAASNVFAIVSPYEGQSIVALQAAAAGLPIIAADAGALPEIARDNENGFLVHTYDYKTLAGKMNKLAEDKNLREKFGRESRNISLLHTRSKVFLKLESEYKKLI